ncbi:MAG: AAA family ATPase [Chitinophagales bacterium]
MKPIRLEFSGLHSYRDRQSIDFAELGVGGLFGIFGPTGGGKSTILDAMTLALFGSVDRADRGTQGILNQRETVAEVTFEFTLGESRYKVDRRYERAVKDPEKPGWDNVQNKHARLVRVDPDGSQVPLVDKPREVTAAVENLLGLRRDDFARAVVLPQGKFDQFLKLTGAHRAEMLQHIFALERYGDELAKRAGGVQQECALKIEGLTGAQSALGDCSEERRAAAEAEAVRLETEVREAEARLEAAQAKYQEAGKLRDLLARAAERRQREAELVARQAQVAEVEARLEAARKAEPLRSLVEQEETLRGEVAAGGADLAALSERSAAAQRVHTARRADREAAEKDFEAQEPGLRQREVELEKAKEAAGRLAAARLKEEECSRKLTAASENAADAAGQEQAQEAALQAGRDLVARLEKERLARVVDLQEKERLDQASEALTRLEHAEELFASAERNRRARQQEVDRRWAEAVAAFQAQRPGEVPQDGADLLELAEQAVAGAEAELEAAQAALGAGQAALLAAQLRPGEPCPVCGSAEHPAPAHGGAEVAVAQAALDAATRRAKEVAAWRSRVEKAHVAWNGAVDELGKAQREEAEQRRGVEEATRTFAGRSGGLSRQEVSDRKQAFRQADLDAADLQRRKTEAERELAGLEAAAAQARKAHAELRESLAGLESQLRELQGQRAAAEGEVSQLAGGADPMALLAETRQRLADLQTAEQAARQAEEEARQAAEALVRREEGAKARLAQAEATLAGVRLRLAEGLAKAGFPDAGAAGAALLPEAEAARLQGEVEEYHQACRDVAAELASLEREIAGRACTDEEFAALKSDFELSRAACDRLKAEAAVARARLETVIANQAKWTELEAERKRQEERKALATQLAGLLRGRKFVQFLAAEHLRDMAAEASLRLGRLTNQRYALELAEECEFVIRDDWGGGQRRPVNTLSGGETFLTSLALALALSSKIQLKGQPLGFFFLDEGFGTLDEEKLDLVIGALEKLHDRERMVGVISHVKELKERLPRYLEVTPATQDGQGSRLALRHN